MKPARPKTARRRRARVSAVAKLPWVVRPALIQRGAAPGVGAPAWRLVARQGAAQRDCCVHAHASAAAAAACPAAQCVATAITGCRYGSDE